MINGSSNGSRFSFGDVSLIICSHFTCFVHYKPHRIRGLTQSDSYPADAGAGREQRKKSVKIIFTPPGDNR